MRSFRIAWVVPRWDEGADRERAGMLRQWAAAAAGESAGGVQIDLLTAGAACGERALWPGVTLRTMAWAGVPRNALDAVSWEIATWEADVFHVFCPFTRAGEAAVLAARFRHLPLVVTECGWESSRLGQAVGILELADVVTAAGEQDARVLRPMTGKPIEVIGDGAMIAGMYRRLLARVPA